MFGKKKSVKHTKFTKEAAKLATKMSEKEKDPYGSILFYAAVDANSEQDHVCFMAKSGKIEDAIIALAKAYNENKAFKQTIDLAIKTANKANKTAKIQ